jgi:undecaprenyl-diphosphatase
MNDYLAAVILGIVEGLTEFLPVSSTAHIRFTQAWLGQNAEDEYWKMFAIVIQLGAILSVLVYFRKRLRDFVVDFFQQATGAKKLEKSAGPSRPLWQHPLALVIMAFVVTAVPCFLIDKKIGEQLENLTMMSWTLIVGGVAMWIIDWWFSRRVITETMDEISWRQALFIGCAQILAAAFPGTSRSMSTIAGGQVVGLRRSAALEFSFFLSIPVMFAATGYKLLRFVMEPSVEFTAEKWGVLATGFVVSFFVAWAVIAWFMNWVRRQGFLPFAIYRIVAGAVLLWWFTSRTSSN